ncbi:hypothetical protein SRABI118_02257 [Massilia sp. Bi118]|uniref:DUF1176 domain-containing protein n=1 Tax=Massilia sp. Bi118 TaxID=2822346 RepID=UPI001DE1E22E|nr:DUF1176 domain-containing protein [Massilia sp. Bi118]CAH0222336.1 hypothetical protein SRABI118_02257 [Massilia sp. Bi118]
MIRYPARIALLLSVLPMSTLYAADSPQLRFFHKDWEIACDNTRTCRAAGYQDDDAEAGVSVLLTRAAGANQNPRVQLKLADTGSAPPDSVQMHVAGRRLGAVKIDGDAKGELDASQTEALLAAVLKDAPISWTAKTESWKLSTKGANAVLLKMDEFQGRLGTPGALVRKGRKSASSVAPALPLPELVAAPVRSDEPDPRLVPAKQLTALLAELRKTLGDEDGNSCEGFDENARSPAKLSAYRLSDSRLLVSLGCFMATYNSGDAYWVTNALPPFAPVMVTNAGSDYSEGRIYAIQKGRGMGDCISSDTWTWDGQGFVHTSSMTTGMCKGIAAGGAWELPTLVVKVKQPK